ncbi:pectate lyase superfamily protein [Brucella thiophenivorans]|uniref:Pectate lyase superfamily protein n=1 Tax=Brucella thiophenivorans TaxID=571255 RepID=A0A256FVS1_9HYPH|nr:pectate lyase superfamily protein [Brucella thiophenivorans]
MTVRTIDDIFRDFVIDGVPASGPFHPYKPDIRDTLKALLEGISAFPDNRVIRLNNGNEGSPNNIVVSASVAIPAAAYQVLYIMNVTQENTGPVTVSGAINRALVTNTNRPIEAGYLQSGMALLCIDTGTELRLLSYGDAEAIQEAAEEAAGRAEAAASSLNLPIIQPGDAGKSLVVNPDEDGYELGSPSSGAGEYESRAKVEETDIPETDNFVRTAGYYSPGDGGGALYIRVSSEPSHAGKVQSDDGAWWELVRSGRVSILCFGAKGDGVTVNTAIQDALNYIKATNGGTLYIPRGVYRTAPLSYTVSNGGLFSGGRLKIEGEGSANSIILGLDGAGNNAATLEVKSSFPDPINSLWFGSEIRGVSFRRNDNTGIGLSIQNFVNVILFDVTCSGNFDGCKMTGVLSSSLYECGFVNNKTGIALLAGALSTPNQVSFFSCKVASNGNIGMYAERPGGIRFYGGSVEGNGVDNPTNSGTGVTIDHSGSSVGTTMACVFDGVYFEINNGDADVLIQQANTTDNIFARFSGCSFQCTGAAGSYVVNRVLIQHTSARAVTVQFDGCTFSELGGFVPNASQRYIRVTGSGTGRRKVTTNDCYFNTAAAAPESGIGSSVEMRGLVNPMMQMGTVGDSYGSSGTFTFDRPFASAPQVFPVATVNDGAGACVVEIYNTTTTGFSFRKKKVSGSTQVLDNFWFSFLAVGIGS